MSPTLMCSRSRSSARSLACVPLPLPWMPMITNLRMASPSVPSQKLTATACGAQTVPRCVVLVADTTPASAPPPPCQRTPGSPDLATNVRRRTLIRPLQHHQRARADRDDAARVDHLAVVEIRTAGVEHDMPRAAVVGVRHVEVDRLAVRGEAQQE